MPIDVPIPINHYIINAESGTEMARLNVQDCLFTQAMGGLFPEHTEPPALKSLLDVACGPGGGALSGPMPGPGPRWWALTSARS